ncbi:MAG TPA: tetratricopeptide repeat protein [Candidatus Binatia bacterium]|nr:tetratricopeptide repeat protein [Candidatus Binatia bacterium]
MTDDRYRDFRQAVRGAENDIDLGRAALAMAASDYPHLDIEGYLSRIDELAATAAARLGAEADAYRSLAALNYVLFKEQGFRGNREHYFDPRNSFLNEVLDRKTGIPISLSVLYMEVAQKIGVTLQGVGFPGHFLVKFLKDHEEIVVDPFNQGEVVSREGLEAMLDRLYGGKMPFDPILLQPVSKKQILRRMLNNLKLIYVRQNDWRKGLSVAERLVVLDPASGEDIRDRGLIYLQLECFKQAQEDLETYLRLVPHAADADAVREQVKVLTRKIH